LREGSSKRVVLIMKIEKREREAERLRARKKEREKSKIEKRRITVIANQKIAQPG
jgi:hypothetical protein